MKIKLRKILFCVLSIGISFIYMSCGVVSRKQYPSELVGNYDEEIDGDYMTLYANGRMKYGHRPYGFDCDWWVENNIIYFKEDDVVVSGIHLPSGKVWQYDLNIAQQDIEYELEHKFKDLSPSEKSERRLSFKFRMGNTMYFKK